MTRRRSDDEPKAAPKADAKKDRDNRAKIAGVLPFDTAKAEPKAKRDRLPSDGPATETPEEAPDTAEATPVVSGQKSQKTKPPKAGGNALEPRDDGPSYQDEVMDAYGIPDPEEAQETGDPGRTERVLDRAAAMLLSRMKSKLSGKDAILGPSSAMIHILIDEVADQLEINHVDVIRAFSAKHYHDPVMYFQINMTGDTHNDAEMLDNHEDNQQFADEVRAVHDEIWEGFSRAEMRDLLTAKLTEHRRCVETNAAVYRATGLLQALEEDIRSLKSCLAETTTAGCVATANGGLAPLSDYEGQYPYYTPKKKKKKPGKQPVVRRVTNEMIAIDPHWVVRNPDREAFTRLLEESRGRLNGLLDRDLFVWPRAASTHGEVAVRHAIDGTEIEIREDRVILTGGGLLAETAEPLVSWVSRHRAVRPLFDRGFTVAVRSSR